MTGQESRPGGDPRPASKAFPDAEAIVPPQRDAPGVRPLDWLRALYSHPLEGVPETEQKLVTAAAYALVMVAPQRARRGTGWTFEAPVVALAGRARICERSMIRALGHLRRVGALELLHRGGQRPNVYRLRAPGGA